MISRCGWRRMSGRKIRTSSTRSSHEVSGEPPSEIRHFGLHQLRGTLITRVLPLDSSARLRASGVSGDRRRRSTCHVGSALWFRLEPAISPARAGLPRIFAYRRVPAVSVTKSRASLLRTFDCICLDCNTIPRRLDFSRWLRDFMTSLTQLAPGVARTT